MATFEDVRAMALALPETSERLSYGTPAFFVRKALFARMWDEESLVVKTSFDERAALLASNPTTFFVTSHHEKYPMVLIRLPHVDDQELRELITDSWRHAAPARLAATHDDPPTT